MKTAELLELGDDALLDYFTQNARYHAEVPGKKYVIQLGNRHLFSDDTDDLREQFFAAVREKGKK